jgi:hypothetical protein
MKRTLALLLVFLALPATAARRRAVVVSPAYPPCAMVTGTPAVTFTHDFGATLASAAEPRQPIAYTYGLAAMLDEPDALMAWHRDDVLYSSDAGCSWRVLATIPGSPFPPRLEPARDRRAYAWSENRQWAVRIDSRGTRILTVPVEIIGLAADPANGEHVRIGGNDGTLWDSRDGGESWTRIGSIPGSQYSFYRFTFDPFDMDHVLAGMVTNGAAVSYDGGRSWAAATGLGPHGTNVFNLIFSPIARDVVWAMGVEVDSSTKRIYRSDDGGRTYRAVVTNGPGLSLINGPTMAADPQNANVLYFIFGTAVFDYGTDIFRYDDSTKTVTVAHHDEIDDINSIAFSPTDPGLMYFGLEIVRP